MLDGTVPLPWNDAQAVDQDTQKAMMAWYYKKQEEQKVSMGAACGSTQHARWKGSPKQASG